MRILQVVTDIRIANGIMSVVLNYFGQMPENIKFDVVYFKDFPENRKKDIEALGGRVYKLSRPGAKSFLKCDWDDFLQKHRGEYEAIHIHAPHLACMIVPKAKKYGIKKVAVHCHSTWYSLFKTNKFRNYLLSIPVKYMNLQRIGCGRDAGEFWYGKNNFNVLPNAVECEKFRFNKQIRDAKRSELGINNKLVIGHLGRVHPPQKNHPFLIQVFAEIHKINTESILVCIGADATDELMELASSYGISDKILFLGQRKDVRELLSAMDVFVFPSFYEGLPVSVVEAQAAGLPVVMSNSVTDEVCCTDKIITLSLEQSAKEWAETAIKYAERGISDTYEQMKKSGWDIKSTAKSLINFYKTGVWNDEK